MVVVVVMDRDRACARGAVINTVAVVVVVMLPISPVILVSPVLSDRVTSSRHPTSPTTVVVSQEIASHASVRPSVQPVPSP